MRSSDRARRAPVSSARARPDASRSIKPLTTNTVTVAPVTPADSHSVPLARRKARRPVDAIPGQCVGHPGFVPLAAAVASTIPMTVPIFSAVTSRKFGGNRPIRGRCMLSHQPDRLVCCDPTSVPSHRPGPPHVAHGWSRVREAHTPIERLSARRLNVLRSARQPSQSHPPSRDCPIVNGPHSRGCSSRSVCTAAKVTSPR
jgi:hypothetical protein